MSLHDILFLASIRKLKLCAGYEVLIVVTLELI